METLPHPLVSVIIPVHNGSLFVEKTVESVLANTYASYEIILVDDASTDNSKTICEELAKKHACIRFFSLPKNIGLSNALNFALQHAKGVYIARINQDDIMMPERLSEQVQFLEKNPDHVAVGGKIVLFDDKGTVIDTIVFPFSDTDIKKRWLYFSPFADPAVMYKKSAYEKTLGYNQNFWPVDDVHMWYQLGKLGKLANLDSIVTKVLWHTQAGSIKSHRLQTQKLFALHLWAAKHIQKPTILVWIFWVAQYIAGYFLPAQYNWWMFRNLRKIFS